MPLVDSISASTALLSYLDNLSPVSIPVSRSEVLNSYERSSLLEYHEDVKNIDQFLEQCSWSISTLLHSLDEMKKSKSLLMLKRAEILDKSAALVAGNPKTIRFSNEILRAIARYVHPKPISVEEAAQLESSGCRWDRIVLESSLIELDTESLLTRSIQPLLYKSDPAKLLVTLEATETGVELDLAVQTLLHFRGRCHSLLLDVGCDGEPIKEALMAVPCAHCPPSRRNGRVLCGSHSIFTSLHTFGAIYKDVNRFSGLLKNVSHLALDMYNYDDELPVDFSGLVAETPLLSELTLNWSPAVPWPDPSPSLRDRAFFPKLRRVFFVQGCRINSGDLEKALWSLDGRQVEVLRYQGFACDIPDLPGILHALQRAFPSMNSLHLDEEPRDQEEENLRLSKILEMLAHNQDSIFPHLTHLRIELDHAVESVDNLVSTLRRGPHQGSQRIQRLDLFTNSSTEKISSIRKSDAFSRIQGEVHHLTVCSKY